MMEDRKAPPGKYRVLGVDKFSDEHWIEDDYEVLEVAIAAALTKTQASKPLASGPGVATVYYVYDENGKYLGP